MRAIFVTFFSFRMCSAASRIKVRGLWGGLFGPSGFFGDCDDGSGGFWATSSWGSWAMCSSTTTTFFLRGALSLAPSGLPRLFGAGVPSGTGSGWGSGSGSFLSIFGNFRNCLGNCLGNCLEIFLHFYINSKKRSSVDQNYERDIGHYAQNVVIAVSKLKV